MKKPHYSVQAGFLIAPGAPFLAPALLALPIAPQVAGILLFFAAYTYPGALLLGMPTYRILRHQQITSLPAYLLAGATVGALYNQLAFALIGSQADIWAVGVTIGSLLVALLIWFVWPRRWPAVLRWISPCLVPIVALKTLISPNTLEQALVSMAIGAVPATLSSLIFWRMSIYGTPQIAAAVVPAPSPTEGA